jgi:hypothetical protein
LGSPCDTFKKWDLPETNRHLIFKLYHGATESKELLLFFIQSGDDDWIKAMLSMNGYFSLCVLCASVVKITVWDGSLK